MRFTARCLISSTVVVATLAAASSAATDAAEQQPSAAQRQAQIERIKDGINSPDPTKRLVTLEQATASRDTTLRRVALSAAFASSDSDLRSVALSAAIGSTATFVVNIAGNDGSNGSTLSRALGTSVEVRVQKFDRSNDTFQASTSLSDIAKPGAVAGDRLSFEFDIGRFSFGSSCSGVAVLQGGTPVLKGSMSCTGAFLSGNYSIAIDMLK